MTPETSQRMCACHTLMGPTVESLLNNTARAHPMGVSGGVILICIAILRIIHHIHKR